MEDIMKIVKLLEKSGLLVKGTKTIAKQNKKKGWFPPMSLGTFASSILGNALTEKSNIKSRWRNNKSRSTSLMLFFT